MSTKTRFTELFPQDLTYNRESRLKKAKKIVAVIRDNKGDLSKLACLDLGCSIGIMTEFFGNNFKEVVGVDVDERAVAEAKKRVNRENVSFLVSEENKLPVETEAFDVVIFNQIYEHAESPKLLVEEIGRVLKPGGACYFGARNRWFIFDGHYRIPFLSWLPRSMSNLLLRAFTGKKEYDIRLFSLKELNGLVKNFEKHDYTLRVIREPKKFNAEDAIPIKFGINRIIFLLADFLYVFTPNYIWILEKRK